MPSTCTVAGIEYKLACRTRIVAAPRYEWDVDTDHPDEVAAGLGQLPYRIDLLTFAQRLPYSRPRFGYGHWEWDNVAAVPISDYAHWFNHQLHRNPRNKLKKTQKPGLEVSVVPFDDEQIRGIKSKQDDVPIRQGRLDVHYRKDFETVRKVRGATADGANRAVILRRLLSMEFLLQLVPRG